MADVNGDTDLLLSRACAGDAEAAQELLARYRDRLRLMVAVRIDARIAGMVQPDDVVQATITRASQDLDKYTALRPLPFFAWLRRIAWERLVELHHQHLPNSATESDAVDWIGPSSSALDATTTQLNHYDGFSDAGLRGPLNRVRAALDLLHPADREVLVLRHLECLSAEESGDVLGIGAAEVKQRHLLAMQRLHGKLHDEREEAGDG